MSQLASGSPRKCPWIELPQPTCLCRQNDYQMHTPVLQSKRGFDIPSTMRYAPTMLMAATRARLFHSNLKEEHAAGANESPLHQRNLIDEVIHAQI